MKPLKNTLLRSKRHERIKAIKFCLQRFEIHWARRVVIVSTTLRRPNLNIKGNAFSKWQHNYFCDNNRQENLPFEIFVQLTKDRDFEVTVGRV